MGENQGLGSTTSGDAPKKKKQWGKKTKQQKRKVVKTVDRFGKGTCFFATWGEKNSKKVRGKGSGNLGIAAWTWGGNERKKNIEGPLMGAGKNTVGTLRKKGCARHRGSNPHRCIRKENLSPKNNKLKSDGV